AIETAQGGVRGGERADLRRRPIRRAAPVIEPGVALQQILRHRDGGCVRLPAAELQRPERIARGIGLAALALALAVVVAVFVAEARDRAQVLLKQRFVDGEAARAR